MNNSQRFRRNIHGISLQVSASTAAIESIASRLGRFPTITEEDTDLNFDLDVVASIQDHTIVKPAGPSRPFYAPNVGEALYFPETDQLYLDYGGLVRSVCYPVEGHCRISMIEPEADHLWLATHPLLTIPLIEMLKRRGKFNIHAAAFSVEGQCILLPGTTGAGKSTLTIALLRAGFDFLGDDMAFLDPTNEMRVLALPENVDVTEATAGFFTELKGLLSIERKPGWPKYEVDATTFFQTQVTWSAKPAAIVFPRISNLPESTLTPIKGDEAFLELAPNALLTEATSTRAHFEALAALVKSTPIYRLATGRDFDAIPGLLRETLQ